MSQKHAARLREMASSRKPPDAFLGRCADMLDHLARVEAAAFEAYDCLGGEEEMRDILGKVCDPNTPAKEQ